MAQSCASNHCIPHLHALSVFFKPLFINFIKLYPMNTCLFSILCDKTGSMHKALLLHVEAWCLSQGNAFLWLSCKLNYLLFSGNTSFTWKNNWQIAITQTYVFGRHLLENEWSESATLRRKTDSICCQW